MAEHINFTIQLVSDAEPSSGFGTELLNSLVPRAADGCPIIPASHIKGLMKQALLDVAESLKPKGAMHCIGCAFGTGGSALSDEAVFSLADARCVSGGTISTVTRTALTEHGTAATGSLRTAECIATGAKFESRVHFLGKPSPLLDTLIRYALLSVMEIGGARNRGCGACCTEIEGEDRAPGALLKQLLPMFSSNNEPFVTASHKKAVTGSSEKQIALKLSFTASGPLCVPELPVVGSSNNTICSGFAIPASAVQGIVLHRINAIAPSVADACFASNLFRAWPMHPVIPKSHGLPVRVSTSHRISKLPDERNIYQFCDEIVQRYDWDSAPKNAPLKGADGVLGLVDGEVYLWRNSDMPRSISAHGVINGVNGERNLFTVESIAVDTFSGIVLMPEDAAEVLRHSLEENAIATVGKSRSVRGSGELRMEILPDLPIRLTPSRELGEVPVFIVQSPLLIENENRGASAGETLKALVESAGWGQVKDQAGSISMLFGWNRHKDGRQKAVRVIEPGSVFRLERTPNNLRELLTAGIGSGRERGYGAVWPHPGVADVRYLPEPERPVLGSADSSGRVGWKLFSQARSSGLTASQIGRLHACLKRGSDKALEYMDRQKNERPPRIWDRWKPIFAHVKAAIEENAKEAEKSLKVWHDLTVAGKREDHAHE